ncbi:MAG: hypothetical protein QOG63_2066 [Thermoleophilaceae bacterium]|jgi:hypothetical protein|nr:hypothetical protein [Thermoleophilaceae bacterium]
MKKLIGITCAVALLVAPAGAIAKQGNGQAHRDAVKTCKELRQAAGKKGFAELYGKKGLGRCIKKETRENAAEQQQAQDNAQSNAAKDCKAERDADPAAFAEQYGTGKKGKNAYGKCVSQHAKADEQAQEQQDAQQDDDQVSAAQQCKDERKADPAAFAAQYGTNANKRNAYGKCVSQKTHEQEQGA